ncbi:MAG TPA: hypothetical protein VI819_01430 [Patescibacteria group bacterium]|nr:hypothetical protein [Patescibacteria group bacterium]
MQESRNLRNENRISKSFFRILIIAGLIFVYVFSKNSNVKISDTSLAPTPTLISEENSDIININGYNFYLTELEYSSVKLIYNLNSKAHSTDREDLEDCKYISSTFFYDKNNRALGLIKIGKNQLSPDRKNNVLNAYIKTTDQNLFIDDGNEFTNNPDIVFQSGPLVKLKGVYQNINNVLDENARRVLIAKSNEKSFLILLVDPNNLFSGPKFSELKDVLKSFEKMENITFDSIANLDGGSASVYKNQENYFTEYSTVGGFLCFE